MDGCCCVESLIPLSSHVHRESLPYICSTISFWGDIIISFIVFFFFGSSSTQNMGSSLSFTRRAFRPRVFVPLFIIFIVPHFAPIYRAVQTADQTLSPCSGSERSMSTNSSRSKSLLSVDCFRDDSTGLDDSVDCWPAAVLGGSDLP